MSLENQSYSYENYIGKVQILTPKDTYTVDYPQAVQSAQEQARIIWFAEELGVEKDEDDIRTRCTEGERHGITTVLKLFTQYELMLGGDEFWGGKVAKMFPRPEIQRMAATYSFIELGVHAPFYDLINKTLNIATDEFYSSWKEDVVLKERMDFVSQYAEEDDPLVSTAAFAFMEGAVLFSSFAFLKSFNSGGYGLIPHITSGIDASAKDENLHSMGSAWLYNQCLKEMKEAKVLPKGRLKELRETIYQIASVVYSHEAIIIDKIFEKGGIRTVTKEDMLHFVRNRIDVVLSYLQMKPLFGDKKGVVSEWFYNQLSSYKYSDFFHTQQVQYVRDWSKHKLNFRSYMQEQL